MSAHPPTPQAAGTARVELLSSRFRLHESVGKGGSSTVFRAIDTETGRWVAIKFLSNDRLGENVIHEMFDREIRSTSQLRHPNIVELLDFGRDAEHTPYLAFEWLPTSLRDELRHRPARSWERFVERYAAPILDALAYAHAQGVAHRDLTPSNVRLTADGVPKITDFGIAKLDAAVSVGTTVRGSRTEPFVPPPGQESSTEFFTRDVYAFGALMLLALADVDAFANEYADRPYEALDEARQRLTLPKPVRNFIEHCLHADPEERPLSAGLAMAELRRAVTSTTGAKIPSLYFTIPAAIQPRVLAAVRAETLLEAIARLEEDFEGELAFLAETGQTEGDKVISVLGSEYQLRCKVDRLDNREDRLVVLGASNLSKWVLGRRRRDALILLARLEHGEPKKEVDAKRLLLELVTQIESHHSALIATRDRGENTLEVWRRTLELEQSVQRKKEDPVEYYKWEPQGEEIVFWTNRAIGADLIGQDRLVRSPEGRQVGGEVVDVGQGRLVMAVDFGDPSTLPRSGVVRISVERTALRRQEDALDALRNGHGPPGLLEVLVDPRSAAIPSQVGSVDFINKDIDEAKQEAIRAALGAPNVLAVHGPPGTGKTTFIAELILQIRRRQPNARVLLSSQTHAALDNVLQRLREIDPGLQLIRLARPGDPRVAPEVSDFLIDAQIAAWKREATARTKEFLRQWARERGLDLKAVESAQNYEDLAALRAVAEELNADVQRLEAELKAETHREEELTTHYETELTRRRQQLRANAEARRQLLLAMQRRGLISTLKELDTETAESLRAMAAARVDTTHADYVKCISLMQLQATWLSEFGIGDEFQAAVTERAAVVAATCVGLAGFRGASEIHFDVCIVDEASKATPTEILIPMLRARKWIVVGDPYQLPPFVEEGAHDADLLTRHELTLEQLRTTVLDRLLQSLPAENSKFLSGQHRMVPPIGSLVSTCFYKGQLRNMPVHEWRWLDVVFDRRVTWLDTSGLPDHDETKERTSYSNAIEARVIRSTLDRLNSFAGIALKDPKLGRSSVTVMVLAAYAGQRALLETELAGADERWPALAVTVGTVDSFQGREADVLLYSLVRSNPEGKLGFLRETARLNVALSRGRKQLVIVGDARFARQLPSEAGALLGVLEYFDMHPDDCSIPRATDG